MVFTPDKSVIVAVNVGKVVQYELLVIGVNEIVGELASIAVPLNSNEPQSGNAGRGAPVKSVVTCGTTVELLSAYELPAGAKTPGDTAVKLSSANVPAPRAPATALNKPHDVLKFGSFVKL